GPSENCLGALGAGASKTHQLSSPSCAKASDDRLTANTAIPIARYRQRILNSGECGTTVQLYHKTKKLQEFPKVLAHSQRTRRSHRVHGSRSTYGKDPRGRSSLFHHAIHDAEFDATQ